MNRTCTPTSGRVVVAIDDLLASDPTLLGAVPDGSEVVRIPKDRDGLGALSQAVAHGSLIDTLHIVSHGAPGKLSLGCNGVDLGAAVHSHSDTLASLSACLAPSAEVLVYGCSVGEGRVGERALNAMSKALGVHVAASTGPVGATALGGDWTLDKQTAPINAVPITAPAFAGLLLTLTFTVSEGQTITIPTSDTSGQNAYAVDWGDGAGPEAGLTGDAVHTYKAAGTYVVTVDGPYSGFRFGRADAATRQALASIESWGDHRYTNLTGAFADVGPFDYNAPPCDVPDLSRVTDLGAMFARSSFNADLSNWDVSGIRNFAAMFQQNESFNNDISCWDSSSAISMAGMFDRARSFDQDLGQLDIRSIAVDPDNPARNGLFEVLNGTALSPQNRMRTIGGWARQLFADQRLPRAVPRQIVVSAQAFGDGVAELELADAYRWRRTGDPFPLREPGESAGYEPGRQDAAFRSDFVARTALVQPVEEVPASDTLAFDIFCFAAGTLIKTDRGEVPIEQLSRGDRVLTIDAGFQPIRWTGSRTLGTGDLLRAPGLAPICIKAGALGPHTPERDLCVAPHHRVLVRSRIAERVFGAREVLVPAKRLLGLPGIIPGKRMGRVTYLHMLLDTHQLVQSEGAWTESLLTSPEVLKSVPTDMLQELREAFPDLADAATGIVPARPIASQDRRIDSFARRHQDNRKPLFETGSF